MSSNLIRFLDEAPAKPERVLEITPQVLRTQARCPHRALWEHTDQWRQYASHPKPSAAQLVGNLTHQALERFVLLNGGRAAGSLDTKLAEYLAEAEFAHHQAHPEVRWDRLTQSRAQARAQALACAQALIAEVGKITPHPDQPLARATAEMVCERWGAVEREQPVNGGAQYVHLHGRADLIQESEGRITIYDWKTEPPDAHALLTQLGLYAIACPLAELEEVEPLVIDLYCLVARRQAVLAEPEPVQVIHLNAPAAIQQALSLTIAHIRASSVDGKVPRYATYDGEVIKMGRTLANPSPRNCAGCPALVAGQWCPQGDAWQELRQELEAPADA